MSGLSAPEVRQKLDHPVVDIDGHTVEFFPALAGELVKEGVKLDGESMARRTSGTFGPDRRLVLAHARGAGRAPGGPGSVGQRRHGAGRRPRHRPAPPSPLTSASPSSASTSA